MLVLVLVVLLLALAPIVPQNNAGPPRHDAEDGSGLGGRVRGVELLLVAHGQGAQDLAIDQVEVGVGVLAAQVGGDLAGRHLGGAGEAVHGGPDAAVVLALPAAVRRDGVHLVLGRGVVVVARLQDLHEPEVALALEAAHRHAPPTPRLGGLALALPRPLRLELPPAPVAREVLPDHGALRVVLPVRQLLPHPAHLRHPVPAREAVQLQREDRVVDRRVRTPVQRRRRGRRVAR